MYHIYSVTLYCYIVRHKYFFSIDYFTLLNHIHCINIRQEPTSLYNFQDFIKKLQCIPFIVYSMHVWK